MKTLLAAVLAISTVSAFAQTYTVDSSASKVTYVGKKVTGEHTGNLSITNGTITMKGDTITGGEFVVDMNTLTSNDITDKDYNAKYTGHLKSADFFDTAKYPTSTLKITSSKKTKKGLEVKGDLTMKGQTKPVTFLVTDLKKTDKTLTGKTAMTLNRTKWGLEYGSTNFFKNLGDKAIHDDFNLSVDLTASVK